MKLSRHRKNRRIASALPRPPRLCPNCSEPGPHFVPPSLGEPGFFTCETPEQARDRAYRDRMQASMWHRMMMMGQQPR